MKQHCNNIQKQKQKSTCCVLEEPVVCVNALNSSSSYRHFTQCPMGRGRVSTAVASSRRNEKQSKKVLESLFFVFELEVRVAVCRHGYYRLS
jgi:hypothetical protein